MDQAFISYTHLTCDESEDMTLNYAIDSVCLWRPRSSKDEKIGNNTCHYLEVIEKGRPDYDEKKKFGV